MNDWFVICGHTEQDASFAHSQLSVFRQYALITRLLVSCNKHLLGLFSIFLNIASFSTLIHESRFKTFL